MTEKEMYVGVDSPLIHRKNLLLCSKDLITSLKNYERLKSIRAEKTERIFELRKLLSEILVMNRRLKQALPKVQLEKQKRKPRTETVKPIPKIKVKSKVDLLQRELDRIENKLKGLE